MKGAICSTTGKIRYPTETKAVGPDTTIGIYFCPHCEDFHRTSRGEAWPQSVVRADRVRDSARRRENFGTLPLAGRLDPDTLDKLHRLAEAE